MTLPFPAGSACLRSSASYTENRTPSAWRQACDEYSPADRLSWIARLGTPSAAAELRRPIGDDLAGLVLRENLAAASPDRLRDTYLAVLEGSRGDAIACAGSAVVQVLGPEESRLAHRLCREALALGLPEDTGATHAVRSLLDRLAM